METCVRSVYSYATLLMWTSTYTYICWVYIVSTHQQCYKRLEQLCVNVFTWQWHWGFSHRKQCAAPLGAGHWPTPPKIHWPLSADLWQSHTPRCVMSVWSVYKGRWVDQRGTGEWMTLVYIPGYKDVPPVWAQSLLLSSLCVSRSKQSLITGHSVEPWGVCVHAEASLWTQAVVAFLALGAGSWSQISRNLRNMRGGTSPALSRRTVKRRWGDDDRIRSVLGSAAMKMENQEWGTRCIRDVYVVNVS